jgi:hypothetical protein
MAETVGPPKPSAPPSIRIRDASNGRRSKSAITNGSKAFIEGNGNSPWYRRWKDIVELHADDLGGQALLSEAQMSLCRRAATLEVELEHIEGQLSLGGDVCKNE